MSTADNLNYDLFGNAIEPPAPAVEPAPPRQSELRFHTPEVAHVPKFTPVKEGQEHPVGKNGQLKLFHEHVWPKGYTPERLAEVRKAAPTIATSTDLQGMSHPEATAMVIDHLARSTSPVEDIQKVNDKNLVISVMGELASGNRGGFVTGKGIKMLGTPAVSEGYDDPHNARRVQQANTLLHEMGHAVDWIDNPDSLVNEPRTAEYINKSTKLKPISEGRAEGYRVAHVRSTRAMRRARKNFPGYINTGFPNAFARARFENARQETLNKELGR